MSDRLFASSSSRFSFVSKRERVSTLEATELGCLSEEDEEIVRDAECETEAERELDWAE